ncbi:MAG TPA: SLBB domain-containing protein [Terriglobales bacterium]|nr:SLBB domain-containing protein [Terriglobales bacterium]
MRDLSVVFRRPHGIFLLALWLGSPAAVWCQQQRMSYSPSTAVDQARSRAEQEADQLVSLSADKIIQLLRAEPGLLLEVKKALVRKAFEQGRVLDPDDLTDDALFRLIQEDQNVRVIATREIEDRQYIRAKPRREELARNLPCRQPLPTPSEAAKQQDQWSQDTKHIPTEEEAYWAKHEEDLDCYLTQYLPGGTAQSLYPQPTTSQVPAQQPYPTYQFPQQRYPQQQYPQPQYPGQQYPPSQNAPQNPSPGYRPYYPEYTQMEPPQGYFGFESTESEMAPIQPEELPNLLSASQVTEGQSALPNSFSGVPGRSNMYGGTGGGVAGLSLPESLGTPGASFGSPFASPFGTQFPGQAGAFPQQGRLENQGRYPLRPYTYPKPPQQPPLRHRPNPYADVPALYDLYAQYSRRSLVLERFGADVFRDGTSNFDELPMDMPVGPEYVVGPGDGLSIDLWGGVSERLLRVVDREGRVALPEVGSVEVSGKSLGEVQHVVQTVLRGQFRDVGADVSLARLRTVRVYVVGDVEHPGPYDVSSLSTPLNALYTAGGPTSGGSLRILEHYRGKQLIETVDAYDLLLHGIRGDLQRLQPGDTIRIPPLSGEVTVEGMVRRPAIYELHSENNLAEVLELAGGVLPSGTLRHVDVERIVDHESRTMLRLDIPETDNQEQVRQALEDFKIQDGDKVKITPILPYADKTVYLDGHVSRPGKFAYREGMKVTDLIKSYSDLLPEPSTSHAEIIRLQQPDYTPVVLTFNLGDALAGKDLDLVLKPFDTVRVFSRYDFEDLPLVTVTGEVRDPGDHLTNGTSHLSDAISLAGGVTRDALLDDAQVFRKTSNGKLEVISVNLTKALAGEAKDDILLQPRDRVFIHKDLNKLDPATVTIEGEVGRPGKYPLADDMTAASLVRLAGGFKRGAYTAEADLTRYDVEQGSRVVSDHVEVPIAKAMAEEPDADVRLRDGDVLTIRQVSGWQDLGATIEVRGEVVHAGTYGIQPGERLSSVLARAGGFLPTAYPYAAVYQRVDLKDLEEKNRADLIERIRDEQSTIKMVPEMDQDDQAQAKAAVLQYKKTIDSLLNMPPAGRLVIHISSDAQKWANTPADIQVRAGDSIYIPKRPSIVIVDGSVYNPTGITYKPGKSAGWYLAQAGGPTAMAYKKGIFVVRADGSVAAGSGGMFSGKAETTEMRPGDMVFVPEQIYSFSTKFKSTLQAAQLATSIGIAAYYVGHF